MRSLFSFALACALALATVPDSRAEDVDAASVLARLKTLAGSWSGERQARADEDAQATKQRRQVEHEFRVSGGGSLVMETMFKGTDHEMINMFHLDGADLVLTHYCAAGNQPRMRLNRAKSTASRLFFDFAGGLNLDPKVDDHIHEAEIRLVDDSHVESAWTSFSKGEAEGVTRFHISRAE